MIYIHLFHDFSANISLQNHSGIVRKEAGISYPLLFLLILVSYQIIIFQVHSLNYQKLYMKRITFSVLFSITEISIRLRLYSIWNLKIMLNYHEIIYVYFYENYLLLIFMIYLLHKILQYLALMYDSDEQNFYQEADQFTIHRPTKVNKRLPPTYDALEIQQKCWKIHHQILDRTISQFTDQLIQQINLNFRGLIKVQDTDGDKEKEKVKVKVQEIDEEDQEQKKIKNKKKQKQIEKPRINIKDQGNMDEQELRQYKFNRSEKLFIPICVRKSQEQYLPLFIRFLMKKLQTDYNDQSQEQERNMGKRKNKMKYKNNVFSSARKINIAHTESTSIPQIAMHLYQKMKQVHIEGQMTICITEKVTKLSHQNLYILEQGLSQSNCIFILPTYHSFEDALYSKLSKHEIIPMKIFEHKHLFSQLMYSCICDQDIMGYLPRESLKLIDDFEDFPITYEEGTKRLIFLLQKLQILRQKKKIKFKYVDIKSLLKIMEKAFSKTFNFFHNKHSTIKKYVKCILDENEVFNILDKYLNKIDYFKRQEQQCLNQTEIVTILRTKLVRYIEKDEGLKYLSKYLTENPEQKKAKLNKKKDKELMRFDIQTKHCMDQKNLLQTQIKQVITHLTSQIRKFASNFKWQEFHYIERKKPMFPYQNFNSIRRLAPIHACLIQNIYERISTPLSRIIYRFCVDGSMDYGELMYYLKDLQLYGLVDIGQSALNPMVTPSFFAKASYLNRSMK